MAGNGREQGCADDLGARARVGGRGPSGSRAMADPNDVEPWGRTRVQLLLQRDARAFRDAV